MRRVISFQWSVFSVVAFLLASMVNGQVVVSKGFQKRLVSVSGFAGNAALGEVVKNDVRLSGYLGLATTTAGEFTLDGSVAGGSVQVTVTQNITKKSIFAKAFPVGADVRRTGHLISDEVVQAITGQRGIAQTRVAFVLKRGKSSELALMDYDGYNVRQLTSDGRLSAHPRWSPDGTRIIYTGYLSGFPDVIELNLETRQRRRLASYPGLNTGAEYSPDGGRIALTLSKDGNPELYAMDANGGGLQRLTRTKGAESSPTWSPDGRQITYVSDDRGSPQIYVIDAGGGEPTRLTTSPSYNTEPAWSRPPSGPDTTPLLAVTSRIGGKFQIGLYDGAGGVRSLTADGADNWEPSWAPNGRMMIFTKSQGGRSRLYLLDVITGEQYALPAINGDATEPAWGP